MQLEEFIDAEQLEGQCSPEDVAMLQDLAQRHNLPQLFHERDMSNVIPEPYNEILLKMAKITAEKFIEMEVRRWEDRSTTNTRTRNSAAATLSSSLNELEGSEYAYNACRDTLTFVNFPNAETEKQLRISLYAYFMHNMVMMFDNELNRSAYALAKKSGILDDEGPVHIQEAMAADGSISAMIHGMRAELSTTFTCYEIQSHYEEGFEDLVRDFGIPEHEAEFVAGDIRDTEIRRIDRGVTHLIARYTNDGEADILLDKIKSQNPDKSPQRGAILPSCHNQDGKIGEIKFQNLEVTQQELERLGELAGESLRLGGPNKQRILIARRVIDCLRGRDLAETGDYDVEVHELLDPELMPPGVNAIMYSVSSSPQAT